MADNRGSLRSGKLHALTSLRFFAALLVVLDHVSGAYLPTIRSYGMIGRILDLGFISVGFFFVLSGYILAVVYLRPRQPIRPGSFFRARIARIFPLYLLTLLLDAPQLFRDLSEQLGHSRAALQTAAVFAAKAVMLQGWLPRVHGIDEPNWSLSVEAFFYLSFPFIGPALWKLRGARLWLVAALVYCGGFALNVGAFNLRPNFAHHFPPVYLYLFALGILLARWQALREEHTGPYLAQLSKWPYAALAAGIAAYGVAIFASYADYGDLILGIVAPGFLAAIWAFSHASWRPAQWLAAAWLVVLGEASFGLYLFHIPIQDWMQLVPWTQAAPMFAVFLALSIGISVLSFYYFEAPARRWILRFGPIHNKETMEAASIAE